MPRTAITPQASPGLGGAVPTFGAVDASNGNSVSWNGSALLLIVKNGDSDDHTLTVKANGSKVGSGLSLADKAITIEDGTEKLVVIDDSAGLVQGDQSIWLDWDASTSMTVAVIRV